VYESIREDRPQATVLIYNHHKYLSRGVGNPSFKLLSHQLIASEIQHMAPRSSRDQIMKDAKDSDIVFMFVCVSLN